MNKPLVDDTRIFKSMSHSTNIYGGGEGMHLWGKLIGKVLTGLDLIRAFESPCHFALWLVSKLLANFNF